MLLRCLHEAYRYKSWGRLVEKFKTTTGGRDVKILFESLNFKSKIVRKLLNQLLDFRWASHSDFLNLRPFFGHF